MPELPEVAAHVERLADVLAGAELAGFRPLHLAALKTFDPAPDAAVGRTLSGTGHRGKYIYLHFDDLHFDAAASGTTASRSRGAGRRAIDLTFVVHLMQGGRLRPEAAPDPVVAPADQPVPDQPVPDQPVPDQQSPQATARSTRRARPPRGAMARWEFSDGRALMLSEASTEHRAGVWLVRGDPEGQKPVIGLGPDADRCDRAELGRILSGSNERIHGFLRDQRRLAGIGRLLANEVLHAARISPFARTNRLGDDQIDRLHEAIRTGIARALAHERSLDAMGRSTNRPSNVHHRIGEPCVVCGDEIRSVSYRRYTVAYCPGCQTGGRVLADNTTSRFLK